MPGDSPLRTATGVSKRPLIAGRVRPSQRVASPRGVSERGFANVSGASALWLFATWMGFCFGLLESLVGMFVRSYRQRSGNPDLWVNWHVAWLAPFSLALLLLLCAILMSVLAHVAPRAIGWLAPRVLVGLASYSVIAGIPGLDPYAAAILVLGIALRAGSYLERYVARPIPLIRATGIPSLVLWAALAVTTGVVPATAELRGLYFGPLPPANAPNVLLIVLDTVRADHLSIQGYHRPTAPNLARLARDGVDFRQARATTPFTLGTHASLFTGHWMSETSARANAPLDSHHRTLAEHFRDRGYASAGFVGNLFYGSAHYGLDRGFLHYYDAPGNITRRVDGRELCRTSNLGEWLVGWFERKNRIFEPLQRRRIDAAEINREALAWIDRTRQHQRPYFLFLNYFDAHSPYSISHSAPRAYARTTSQCIESNLEHLKRLETEEARDPSLAARVASLRAETAAQVADAYDDGIAWIDHHLGLLFRELETRGLLENTLIVVTSDHGEMLGEHGLIGHGQALYRELVHVPLLVRGTPAMATPRGRAVDVPVSVRDVPATILDLLGERASPFPGVSLRRYWDHGSPENLDTPVVSEMQHLAWQPKLARTPAAFGPMWVLTRGTLAYHRQDHEQLGTHESLFDFDTDPGEVNDLSRDPQLQQTLIQMREDLNAWRSRVQPGQ